MNVVITHLKAPWPAGAAVGSVVALAAATVPDWAVGKCKPAPDDAEPEFTWEPPAPVVEPEFVVNPATEADERARAAEAMLQAAEAEIAELRRGMSEAADRFVEQGDQLRAARAQVEALTAALAEANGKVDQLGAALAEAQKPAADAPAPEGAAPALATKKGAKA